MSASNTVPTYGNIIKPGRQGLMGLPVAVSLMGVPFIIVIILLVMKQWFIPALGVGVAGVGAALLVTIRGRDGRNFYERRSVMLAHRLKTRRGDNLYFAGPAGRVPDGKVRLPGLLSASELTEHRDSFDNAFGLIQVKATNHYTIVLEAYPDGDALVDQRQIDFQVAHWGAWLGQLGVDEGIAGASVTVETAPDSGLRLARMVSNNMAETGSEFARAVVAEIPEQLRGQSPSTTTRIAVTFSGKGHEKDEKHRGLTAMADEIGNRIPVLISTLFETGAGTSVRACSAQDIVDFTRAAYDPTVAPQIEQARAEGGTGLTWADAGPVFADDRIDSYFHDRAVSKSWQMFEGPHGQFYSTALKRMVEPIGGVLRKRVTILYRPIPAGEASSLVESDINGAVFAGSQKQRPSARQAQRLAYAKKASQEEAQGAGIVRFGVIVTVTCDTSAEFPRLDRAIPSLSNQARLRVRTALGNQAVAFQAGLPLGLVLPEHTMIPAQMRDWI